MLSAAWGCCLAAAWVTNSAGAFYFDDSGILSQRFASKEKLEIGTWKFIKTLDAKEPRALLT